MKSAEITDGPQTKPVDSYNIVYLVYLFYGIGFLLPWTIILACLDFLSINVSIEVE